MALPPLPPPGPILPAAGDQSGGQRAGDLLALTPQLPLRLQARVQALVVEVTRLPPEQRPALTQTLLQAAPRSEPIRTLLQQPQLWLAQLRLGRHGTVPAITDQPLKAGQALPVQVAEPQGLRVLPTTAAVPQKALLQAALTTAQSRQQPLPLLLQASERLLAQPPAQRPLPLPAAAERALGQWLQQQPSLGQLSTAAGLRQAIGASGISRERQLLPAPTPPGTHTPPNPASKAPAAAGTVASAPGGDTKTLLSQVLGALGGVSAGRTGGEPLTAFRPLDHSQWHLLLSQTPPLPPANATPQRPQGGWETLLSLLFPPPNPATPQTSAPQPAAEARPAATWLSLLLGGLAKVQAEQYQTLSQRLDGRAEGVLQQWQLELPFRHGEHWLALQLRVQEREPEGGGEQAQRRERQRRWQVQLGLTLPDLGPLHAQVQLQQQRAAVQLWLGESTTLAKVERALPWLRQRFEDSGLQLAEVYCRHGEPAWTWQLHSQLVDVHT